MTSPAGKKIVKDKQEEEEGKLPVICAGVIVYLMRVLSLIYDQSHHILMIKSLLIL